MGYLCSECHSKNKDGKKHGADRTIFPCLQHVQEGDQDALQSPISPPMIGPLCSHTLSKDRSTSLCFISTLEGLEGIRGNFYSKPPHDFNNSPCFLQFIFPQFGVPRLSSTRLLAKARLVFHYIKYCFS